MEILVSIVLVGVLSVVLMSATSGVMNRANDSRCIANLRTIAGAAAAFAADYNFLPSFNREDVATPTANGTHPWFYPLIQYRYLPVGVEDRESYPCLVSKALTCPANKTNLGSRYQWTSSPFPWRPNYTTTTYWGNNPGNSPTGGRDRVRPSLVTNPSAIYLIDSTTSTMAGYPDQAADWKKANCFIAKVHGGGANALLANGSVIRITPESHPDISEPKYWDPRYVK